MRDELTRDRLRALWQEIARTAPPKGSYRVYLVGGGTAVYAGWRPSSIDADLFSEQDEVFRDIQGIKDRLNINVEFVRPEVFVPALEGSENRHVFLETIGSVAFYHYDPYAQALAKILRGLRHDVEDARQLIGAGWVDPARLRSLVAGIPETAYSKYPNLSRRAVVEVVDRFLKELRPNPPRAPRRSRPGAPHPRAGSSARSARARGRRGPRRTS